MPEICGFLGIVISMYFDSASSGLVFAVFFESVKKQ